MKSATRAGAQLSPPLVVRFGAFGDMVLLTVLLRQLHARFGQPVDVISSGVWTEQLLRGQPAVGRLFVIRSRRTPYWMSPDQWRLTRWLRKRGPGPTWFCDLNLGMDLLRRGGIPDDFICDSRAHPWLPAESFADRYVRLANETPVGLTGRLPPPRVAVSRAAQIVLAPQSRSEFEAWLTRHGWADRGFVVVQPGSRHIARRGLRSRVGTDKYWPEERWGEVIRAVRELRTDLRVFLAGTLKEYAFNADILAAAAATEVYNIAGDLPIHRLLPLLERAHSMISVDTGPAHAAAALGCPTVSLFATADAALYRPGGATTPAIALTGQVAGAQNILGITAQTVIRAWTALVDGTERDVPFKLNR